MPTIFHQILIVIHEANMNLYICDCLCAGPLARDYVPHKACFMLSVKTGENKFNMLDQH